MRWVPHRNARDSARVRAGARPGASGSIESMDVLFDIPLAALPVPCALAAFALAACVFAWAGVVDAARRIVPNAAVLAGVGIWCAVFAAAAASADAGPLRRACFAGLAGALAAAGFSGACACVLSRVSGRAALGMGDVKLLFAAGLFLGAAGALVCLGAACALAALYACARFAADALMRGLRSRSGLRGPPARAPFDGTFAFAPFLCASFLAVAAVCLAS